MLKKITTTISPQVLKRIKASNNKLLTSKGWETVFLLPNQMINYIAGHNHGINKFVNNNDLIEHFAWLRSGYAENNFFSAAIYQAVRVHVIINPTIEPSYLECIIKIFNKGRNPIFSLEYHVNVESGRVEGSSVGAVSHHF